jgi:hypothetical protein
MSEFLNKVDRQVQRALALFRDGDRAPYFLTGENTFFGGQNTPVQVAFSVPADGDFYGDNLTLQLEARSVDDLTGVADPVFTSADWTTTNDVVISTTTLTTDDIGSVSGSFDLLLPERYANQATSIGALFSSRHGYGSFGNKQSFSAFPSKLEFCTPLHIPRGVTATLVFTPGYSRAAAADTNTQTEYRIRALLEGFKKVKTLREVSL